MTACAECGEARDTAKLDGKQYCLECLEKKLGRLERVIRASRGAYSNRLKERTEEIRGAIWVLEQGAGTGAIEPRG